MLRVLGKGRKERIVPFGTPRPEPPWPALTVRVRLAPKHAQRLFVNRTGRSIDRPKRPQAGRGDGSARWHCDPERQPAHPPAQLRDPSAGAWRRSAGHPGASGPRQPLDDPALHPCRTRATCWRYTERRTRAPRASGDDGWSPSRIRPWGHCSRPNELDGWADRRGTRRAPSRPAIRPPSTSWSSAGTGRSRAPSTGSWARSEEARDLCQEAFLKAYRGLGGVQEGGPLLVVALPDRPQPLPRPPAPAARARSCVSLDELDEEGHEPGGGAGPERRWSWWRRATCRSAWRRRWRPCPTSSVRSIVLKEYQGLTFPEIAEVLDVPVSTVKTRLYRGLVQLREHLAHEGIHSASAVPAPLP